jgi:hypothetical protein
MSKDPHPMSESIEGLPDVREVLGIGPADPVLLKRFGPPYYTEEQVKAYASVLLSLQGGNSSSSASLPAAPDGATEGQHTAGHGWDFDAQDFGRHLFEEWRRAEDRGLRPWVQQSDTRQKMWRGIAVAAARYLYAVGRHIPAEIDASSPSEASAGTLPPDEPIPSPRQVEPPIRDEKTKSQERSG